MKIGFFYHKNNPTLPGFPGIVEKDAVFAVNNFSDPVKLNEFLLKDLEAGCPVQPTKIVAIGLNYVSHAREMKDKLPETPLLFLKPASGILAHNKTIIYPSMSKRVDYEAELGVVIKNTAKNILPGEADEYILGYTCFNDVTARDLQSKDGQWTRAKGFDTFAPFGPFIETDVRDPQDLKIQSILNGQVMQNGHTSQMIFSVPELVSFASRVMTLYPGDVIATGTPDGIGPMEKGDEIIIRIEGLDDLVNKVG
jgi:2-keto-4-pentenoate hydratase/2-oxohepta-3-ene-1,7-dioic acid hydratase in catechol pathway